MGASLHEGLAQRHGETLDGLGTLAAKRAFHQFDEVESRALRLRAQIGFAVAKAILRRLLPAPLVHAFDGEEIKATLFQPLRDPGENGREIADIDQSVGGEDEIIGVAGFRKYRLDITQDEIVVNTTMARRIDHARG